MDQKNFDELLKDKNDTSKVTEFVNNNLSKEQKSRLSEILSDKDKLKSILESSKAQELINKYFKG
ncbi:MAG: hypothetical protein IIX39_01515 [Clostridia bacterium]|nr:hypothetical protein [Clostridia bacterium]